MLAIYFAMLKANGESMQLKNSKQQYGWVSIVMHWLMAIIVFGMFGLGIYMVDLTYMDDWYKTAPDLHIGMGMLLLGVLVIRLCWRIANEVPVILGSKVEQKAGLWVHRLHYVLMFLLMFSGYLIVTAHGRGIDFFGWFDIPAIFPAEKGREALAGDIHFYLAWGFMGFVALHAAAALKHHFIDKDRTLLRMLGIRKGEKDE